MNKEQHPLKWSSWNSVASYFAEGQRVCEARGCDMRGGHGSQRLTLETSHDTLRAEAHVAGHALRGGDVL